MLKNIENDGKLQDIHLQLNYKQIRKLQSSIKQLQLKINRFFQQKTKLEQEYNSLMEKAKYNN